MRANDKQMPNDIIMTMCNLVGFDIVSDGSQTGKQILKYAIERDTEFHKLYKDVLRSNIPVTLSKAAPKQRADSVRATAMLWKDLETREEPLHSLITKHLYTELKNSGFYMTLKDRYESGYLDQAVEHLNQRVVEYPLVFSYCLLYVWGEGYKKEDEAFLLELEDQLLSNIPRQLSLSVYRDRMNDPEMLDFDSLEISKAGKSVREYRDKWMDMSLSGKYSQGRNNIDVGIQPVGLFEACVLLSGFWPDDVLRNIHIDKNRAELINYAAKAGFIPLPTRRENMNQVSPANIRNVLAVKRDFNIEDSMNAAAEREMSYDYINREIGALASRKDPESVRRAECSIMLSMYITSLLRSYENEIKDSISRELFPKNKSVKTVARKVDTGLEKENKRLKEEISKLKAENKKLYDRSSSGSKRDNALEARYEILKIENKNQQEMIDSLIKQLNTAKETIEDLTPYYEEHEYTEYEKEAKVANVDVDKVSSEHNIVILGGHENLINKMRSKFPNLVYINDGEGGNWVDTIEKADLIVCKADHLSHGLWAQARNAQKQKNVPVEYFTKAQSVDLLEKELKLILASVFDIN